MVFHQIIEILLQVYIPQNYVQIVHFMNAEHCFGRKLFSTTGHLHDGVILLSRPEYC